MNTLGLDISLRSTGWCCYNGNPRHPWDCDIIKTSDKTRGVRRLHFIRERVHSVLNSFTPKLIVIEGYSFGSHGAHYAGEIGGIIRLLCFEQGFHVVEIPPLNLKQFVTGSGAPGVQKSDMKLQTYKRWGAEFSDDNMCDAFCLALVGEAILGRYVAMHGKLTIPMQKALLKVTEIYKPLTP